MISHAAPEVRGVIFCRLWAVLAGATMVAAAVLPVRAVRAAELAPAPETNLPAFELPQFGKPPGTSLALAGQPGDVILVHFFASWCEPCREELPALGRLAARGGPGMKVMAIAVADNDAPLRRVLEATGVTFPVLLDRDRAVVKAWTISTLPSTIILDAQHQARLVIESDYDWDTITPKQLTERLSSPHTKLSAQQSLVTKGER